MTRAAAGALASLIAAAPVAADQEEPRKPRRDATAAVAACEDFLRQAMAAPGSAIRPGSYVRQGIDVGWLEDDAVVAVVIDFSAVYAHGAGAAAMSVACLYRVEDRRIVGARVSMGYRTFRVP